MSSAIFLSAIFLIESAVCMERRSAFALVSVIKLRGIFVTGSHTFAAGYSCAMKNAQRAAPLRPAALPTVSLLLRQGFSWVHP